MINGIRFNLSIELEYPPESNEVEKVMKKLMEFMNSDFPNNVTFEELDKVMCFSARKYSIISIDFAQLNHDNDEPINHRSNKGIK